MPSFAEGPRRTTAGLRPPLDAELSTDDVPVHAFDRVHRLSARELVELQIDLLPLGLTFQAGQQLRFFVSGKKLLGTLIPGVREYEPANAGQHIVLTEGERASHLHLPLQARS